MKRGQPTTAERVRVAGIDLQLVVDDVRDWADLTVRLARYDLLPYCDCPIHGRLVLVVDLRGGKRDVGCLALAPRPRAMYPASKALN